MVKSGEDREDEKQDRDLSDRLSHKIKAVIRKEHLRTSMLRKQERQKEGSHILRRCSSRRRCLHSFSDVVESNHDVLMTTNVGWKRANKVDTDHMKGKFRGGNVVFEPQVRPTVDLADKTGF